MVDNCQINKIVLDHIYISVTVFHHQEAQAENKKKVLMFYLKTSQIHGHTDSLLFGNLNHHMDQI